MSSRDGCDLQLAVTEPSSALDRRLWDESHDVVTVEVTYVEAAVAFAQARRLERLSASGHRSALRVLAELRPQMTVARVDETLVQRAATLAHDCGPTRL